MHIINVHDSGVCEGEFEIKKIKETKSLSNASSQSLEFGKQQRLVWTLRKFHIRVTSYSIDVYDAAEP